ncbi:FAD-dependent oxidoreductase [Fulvivirga sp.]|uniref:NAD(P)/FAD-dependent oxidoreductase n=1 Tax=Fulvivirga sp. TaxID=1931237 RepID=UPI0032EC4329
MKDKVDYIIVGGGIAGCTLAYHLIEINQSVIMYDKLNNQSASRVAAGLYNPITGRKMVKTWKADLLFPYLNKFYREVEERTNQKFLIEKEIYRPFHSVEEQNEWMSRSGDESYIQYINTIHQKSLNENYHDQYGGISLANAGYLNVGLYLSSVRAYLKDNGVKIVEDNFEVQKLKASGSSVEYNKVEASKIIFCDGAMSLNNQYFSWLPYKLVKGELLEIESDLSEDNRIINRGVFVIPKSKNRFRVGATYENYDLTLAPTEKGKSEIEAKLKELINVDYKVVDHFVGIRPATKDRKPFVGMHPNFSKVGIFNGLGAKGVSQAPYFANQFARFLVNQSELDQEIDIKRYYSLFDGKTATFDLNEE